MSTVTKVTANPFVSTAPTVDAAAAAVMSFDASALADWKLLKKFEARVVGQSDAAKEPTKGLATWITSSATARKATGVAVDVSSNVSSYVIVVDVTTKKALADYPVFCGLSGTDV